MTTTVVGNIPRSDSTSIQPSSIQKKKKDTMKSLRDTIYCIKKHYNTTYSRTLEDTIKEQKKKVSLATARVDKSEASLSKLMDKQKQLKERFVDASSTKQKTFNNVISKLKAEHKQELQSV